MSFPTEPFAYEKGILSELQGAWEGLRESIADCGGFDGADRALFQIDEACSWEVVRRLEFMSPILILVRNICLQGEAPREVIENVEILSEVMAEVEANIKAGKVL
jgi:hypothetical protein